jgi:hypothetical protein
MLNKIYVLKLLNIDKLNTKAKYSKGRSALSFETVCIAANRAKLALINRRVTTMLLTISFMYIGGHLPYLIFYMIKLQNGPFSSICRIISYCSLNLLIICKILVYYGLNQSFRLQVNAYLHLSYLNFSFFIQTNNSFRLFIQEKILLGL